MWFTALIPVIMSLIGRILPDPQAQNNFKIELVKALSSIDVAQIQVNQAEAATGNVFLGGWRPFIGWICAAAFCWQFLLMPILVFICALAHYPLNVPVFDMESMISVLMGMLGLASLRTYEKLSGIENKGWVKKVQNKVDPLVDTDVEEEEEK